MSVVYEATDELLGRAVAVKLLELDESEWPGASQRFRREAQIAASLNHVKTFFQKVFLRDSELIIRGEWYDILYERKERSRWR